MRSVLVTRPQPVAEEFAEKLRGEGYFAYVAPMMEYVGIEADLADLAPYQALVFTSAQAVQVFSGRSAERHLPVFAVGDATAASAQKAGFAKVFSAHGDSGDLATLIKAEVPALELKKILHLCGEDTAGEIGASVTASGVEVVRLPIYKARFLDEIPADVLGALQHGVVDVVTVFSERTAENLVRLLRQKELQGASARLEAVCISERIAVTLKELPWRTVCVTRHPRMEAVMEALRELEATAHKVVQERRRNADRRQKLVFRDSNGLIDTDTYKGADRRSGLGRREYEKLQQKRIMQEKLKFLNRSVLTFAFMFIAIVLFGVFLMAPEYSRLNKSPQWMDYLHTPKTSPLPQGSVGGILNSVIEVLQGIAAPFTGAIGQMASSATQTVESPDAPAFSQVLENMVLLRGSVGGEEAAAQAMNTLRQLLAGSSGDHPEEFNRSVDEARHHDRTLNALLGPMKSEDLAAGAMLLVLNEFRSNIDNHRPYAQDLALLKKFAGNDPRMNQALQHLAPYAEKGVMSRTALQTALKGMAGDIVTAKLQGQDISVQQAARKRLDALTAAGDAAAVKGKNTDAAVARAQLLLDKGDVKGAMRELQTLDGAAAQAAEPWMDNAAGYVIADQSSDDLTQGMLQSMAGAGGFSASDLMDTIKGILRGPSVPYISPALTKGGDGGKDVLAPR